LLGGTGSVEENVGLSYCTSSLSTTNTVIPINCDLSTVESGIASSEYGMMNLDVACCNNGHRDNILNPDHTSVSIGIAYNSTTDAVYLVEDFENAYISSESLQLSGSTVTLQGATGENLTGWTSTSSGAQIAVYYDPPPTPINTSELVPSPACSGYSELDEPASCQYVGGYGLGTLVTYVLAPCPQGYVCGSGQFTYAQEWSYSPSSGVFTIAFSIASFESSYGPGVYTLYLIPEGANSTSESITSLSLFVEGS